MYFIMFARCSWLYTGRGSMTGRQQLVLAPRHTLYTLHFHVVWKSCGHVICSFMLYVPTNGIDRGRGRGVEGLMGLTEAIPPTPLPNPQVRHYPPPPTKENLVMPLVVTLCSVWHKYLDMFWNCRKKWWTAEITMLRTNSSALYS